MSTRTDDTLMLTGTTEWCPDCEAEVVLVAPDLDDRDGAELACTVCGAAILRGLSAAPSDTRSSRIA